MRWTLDDPDSVDFYTFPVNPKQMASVHAPRSLQVLTTAPSVGRANSQGRVIESNQEPYEWSFKGYIRTQGHHDQLRYWSRKVNRLLLTDHFGREWSIRITAFLPEEKQPTALKPWRFDYEIKALMYGPAA